MNTRMLKACRHEKTDRKPIWLMRQAGRFLPEYREVRKKYDVLTLCKTPQVAAEVAAIPVEKFGVDAAVIFADILLPLEAIGVSITIKDDSGPLVREPVRTREKIQSLKEFHKSRMHFVGENIRLTRKALNDSVPVIGFSGAPFTLASYLIEGGPSKDFTLTKVMMLRDHELWAMLMGRLAAMIAEYLTMQARSGAKILQLFDTWVGCLNPLDYKQYVLPYSKLVIEQVSKTGVPIIHFGTNTASLLGLMSKAGADVIGVDWRIGIDEAWQKIGYQHGIQGNLDPAVLLSDAKTIKRYAEEILRKTEGLPGHIFNLGHGVLPGTPPRNVRALVDYVHSYTAT